MVRAWLSPCPSTRIPRIRCLATFNSLRFFLVLCRILLRRRFWFCFCWMLRLFGRSWIWLCFRLWCGFIRSRCGFAWSWRRFCRLRMSSRGRRSRRRRFRCWLRSRCARRRLGRSRGRLPRLCRSGCCRPSWRRPIRLRRCWCGARCGCRSGRNCWRDRFARCYRLCCSYDRRTPVIRRSKLLAVLGGLLARLHLCRHRRNSLLAHCGDFRGQWRTRHPTGTVVADAGIGDIHGRVVDDYRVRNCAVVNLDIGDVRYIVDRTVVIEAVSVPISALITDSYVSESIVDSAVIADVAAPVPVVVAVTAARISPVSWSPQDPNLGRMRPRTGNPIVALRRIAPIAGRPDVAVSGAIGLRIFRQRRRGGLGVHVRFAVVGTLIIAVVIGVGIAARPTGCWLACGRG